MAESELYRSIPLAFSNGDTRLWRANAGLAWAGTILQRTPRTLTLMDYRPIKLGPDGFSDLFGVKRTLITPEMAGRYLGVFSGIECKSERGKPTDQQALFLDLLRSMHAYHGIARSIEDARRILTTTADYP